MGDLEIDTYKDGGVVQLALTGEFDLTGLRFMDSSGLRALVTADDRARKQQRRLAIVPGPPEVRRVFEITKLDTRLDLIDDASAVAG
jgi:anti-anti-sigma factor